MKKNLKGFVEQFEGGEATTFIDMNQYDMIESSGMTPDLVHKKSAHMTAAWRFSQKSRVCIPVGGSDLSGYRFLTFSVFAVGGVGGSFCLMMASDNGGEGKNGYAQTFPITRDGWNDYRVELPFMRAVGEPSGWDRVGSVCFDCVVGGQANREDTVLYLDNLFVWEQTAPPLYATMPELKGAAVFSKSGSFAIVDRKRIANSIDGEDAHPFERDGILWIPMAPVAAGIARSAVVDNRAFTLSFTYRRKKYLFSGDSDRMKVGDEEEPIGFYPAVRGGNLFFPVEFVKAFFHWRQCFIDPAMGLVVLSNRRSVFETARDESVIGQLVADTTFLRPTATRILEDLHRRFPNPLRGRLLASFDELMQLRRLAKTDAQLKGYLDALKKDYGIGSEAFAAPCTFESADVRVLSDASQKMIAFSTLYRLTGDKSYSERAAAECEALANATWTVSVAELAEVALAMSLTYDWCHHVWSEGRKALIERTLLRGVMRPGVEAYDGKRRMWREGSANAAAINAGMLAAALALADVYPQTSYKLLERILSNVEPCFAAYAPDGGYAEGASAWEKSNRALALLVAMLQKACGSDYGLSSYPGFANTAYFAIYAETKNGAWNYHHATATSLDTSLAFFFARLTGDPVPAWMRRQAILSGKKRVDPFDLLFFTPVDDAMTPHLPLDAVYRRAGLAMMRAGWNDDSAFVGLHGGKNNELGGELDAGSVLLEMGGERFFVELGGDESLPLLLRKRAEGQNTLTVEPAAEPAPDQNPDAFAKLTEMRSSPARAYAVLEMTSISDLILRAKRGAMLTEGRSVAVIQDEITLSREAEVVWTAWTRADVSLNKSARSAKLTQNGKTLVCKLCGIASPARFAVRTLEGTDLSCLTVRVTGKEKLRMSVVCRLLGEGESASQKVYDVIPMSRWSETEA